MRATVPVDVPAPGRPSGRLPLLVLLAASCGGHEPQSPSPRELDFVDSRTCATCHAAEWDRWVGSHHDLAMQVATEETVLGDFDDAAFEHLGVVSRFFRRDGRFYVNTEGPEGELADFEIGYTFGVEPLQQYLVEFPGGKLQCLTIAWDTERGRWFHLYPDERVEPSDQLHWTGRYQRWNAMCAECHSTQLEKNYDPETDTYATTWHEIDVGCQTCHGPGSAHVSWAEHRTPDDAHSEYDGLGIHLERGEAGPQLDACAPCHSRRSQIDPDYVHGDGFLENFRPEHLSPGLYEADGQILDEVYVYGSFVQSKMHAAGVACSDCHDPHSLQLLETGDALCMQCHIEFAPLDRFPTLKAKDYAAPEHHHHPVDSEGARCVNCHMPARTYMVVDERRDHSFRIPRPDLTAAIGTPNTCNACHRIQTPQWAAERVAEWYGPRAADEHFARTFAAARSGDPRSYPGLAELALDPERPAIVRATALDLLGGFGREGVQPAQAATGDPDPLVRAAAVRGLDALPAPQRLAAITLLEDEALPVRAEAARVMAAAPIAQLGAQWGAIFDRALGEFRRAQELSADMPGAHLNLGVLYEGLKQVDEAEREYTLALAQDPRFLPARFNLATLLNRQGRNRGALAVLTKGLELAPDEGELYYSLGLLLAEMGDVDAAADALLAAAARLPQRPGVQRNAGLALQRAGRPVEAERILSDGARLYPEDPELQHALAYVYAASGDRAQALEHAARLRELVPESPPPEELVESMLADLAGDPGR